MKCIENNGDRFLIEFTKAEVDELWWFECYPREGQEMGEFCLATYLAELYPSGAEKFIREVGEAKKKIKQEVIEGLTDTRKRQN